MLLIYYIIYDMNANHPSLVTWLVHDTKSLCLSQIFIFETFHIATNLS